MGLTSRFRPKSDRSLRFFVDYRRSNAITGRESYSFLRLDANFVYWQIEMNETKIDRTAFFTHHGLYKYNRMYFEMKNAPTTFQKAMDSFLLQ